MGFSLKIPAKPAPEKSDPTAKNRVWGFFGEAPEVSRQNRPQSLQPRRENRPTTTKVASGRAYWPSRDPIGERGGINLYGMVGNDPVGNWDYLGLLEIGDILDPLNMLLEHGPVTGWECECYAVIWYAWRTEAEFHLEDDDGCAIIEQITVWNSDNVFRMGHGVSGGRDGALMHAQEALKKILKNSPPEKDIPNKAEKVSMRLVDCRCRPLFGQNQVGGKWPEENPSAPEDGLPPEGLFEERPQGNPFPEDLPPAPEEERF